MAKGCVTEHCINWISRLTAGAFSPQIIFFCNEKYLNLTTLSRPLIRKTHFPCACQQKPPFRHRSWTKKRAKGPPVLSQSLLFFWALLHLLSPKRWNICSTVSSFYDIWSKFMTKRLQNSFNTFYWDPPKALKNDT